MVEVGVLDDPVESAVQDLLVGVGHSIFPLRVSGLGNLDVGRFAKGVLGGIDVTYLDVELWITVTTANDDWLTGKGSEWFKDGLTESLKDRNVLGRITVGNAVGLLLMFPVVEKIPKAIKAGKSVKISKGDFYAEVGTETNTSTSPAQAE